MQDEIVVRIVRVDGSAPREVGASITVSERDARGTIGGGRLEFEAISAAREMLRMNRQFQSSTVKLGPELGQCCGGSVELAFERSQQNKKNSNEDNGLTPKVVVFGAGHVGLALSKAFALVPVDLVVVDSRPEYIDLLPDGVKSELCAAPEAFVSSAAPRSGFIVLTHEHSVDFLIVEEVLKRSDAGYLGMIGSKTKRAVLEKQLKSKGIDATPLICPIGITGYGDKRPEVIAASVVPEVLAALRPAP